mmetsp:Transcript_116723/g.326505  ORF Transcript_116723/g.326505 Transcript_116723/m.326505 type:complete len:226 (-) Transcript_116723:116-793(-)
MREVAADVPEGGTTTEGDAPVFVGRPSGEDAGRAEYRVMQGPLFRKPGADPSAPKIVRLVRPVGSRVRATGRTWRGPSGGMWIELDTSAGEKPGWLLVEGPGFNQPGPHLERVEPGEEEPLVLRVLSPIDDSHLCDICVRASQTVGDAKRWVALRLPGLRLEKIIAAREKPSGKTHGMGLRNFPASWVVEDAVRMRDSPFESGGEFVFFYMGDAAEDVAAAEAAG